MGSVADQYYLNPSGGIDLKGLTTEVLYMKSFADKFKLSLDCIYIDHTTKGQAETALLAEHVVKHQRIAELEHLLLKLVVAVTNHILHVILHHKGLSFQYFVKHDFEAVEPEYYQIRASFETCDSMGANFINTILEAYASCLEIWLTMPRKATPGGSTK